MLVQIIKDKLLKFPFVIKKYKEHLIKNKKVETYKNHCAWIEDAEKVFLEKPLSFNVSVGLVKDKEMFADYISKRAYYPKYERFLINNNISYGFYDINKSDWIEEAKKFDAIIWHTSSDPVTQDVALNKIYFLEKVLNKKCLPSLNEVWSYEDKANMDYLYTHYNLEQIPTFISHDKQEALDFVETAEFPIISKLTTGSSSKGVEKVNNIREARSIIRDAFSIKGRKIYFPYKRQKDYVLFQKFIPNAQYDLRVIVIGENLFGYYRYPNKGDFRASGSGNESFDVIDPAALDIAYLVKQKFKANCLATDFLYNESEKKYYIIESSVFIGIDSPKQLRIDNEPGYYIRKSKKHYKFIKGKYWLQELTLKEFFKNNYS